MPPQLRPDDERRVGPYGPTRRSAWYGWRWRWDLNPRRLAPHALSRRAPSAARTRYRRRAYKVPGRRFRPARATGQNPPVISSSAVRRVLAAAALVLAAAACAPEPAAPPAADGSCEPGALPTLTAGTLTFGT